jgi:hypothetical protein
MQSKNRRRFTIVVMAACFVAGSVLLFYDPLRMTSLDTTDGTSPESRIGEASHVANTDPVDLTIHE